jgi:hypothetical protein
MKSVDLIDRMRDRAINFPLAVCRQLLCRGPALLRGEVGVGRVILSVRCTMSVSIAQAACCTRFMPNRAVNSRANQTYSTYSLTQ